MPNWCSNTINIEGPADKIRALWESAHSKQDAGLLEAMVPQGEWDYDRAVASWGTKWDISLEGLEFIDNGQGRAMITGWADSAWAPPVEAFQTYANKNDDVNMELKYFEPGMCFVGVWDNAGGAAYYEDVSSLLETTEEEDAVLYSLLEDFAVADWYETDEEEVELNE